MPQKRYEISAVIEPFLWHEKKEGGKEENKSENKKNEGKKGN